MTRTPHPSEAWIARACGQQGPWADPAALREWQLRALRQSCARAARNSPFYRNAFVHLPQVELAAGRWPRDFDQFAAAPFTLPEDLSAGWSDFLCVGLGQIARMVSLETSGTTDHPKRIAFSAADLERIVAYFAVGIGEMVRPEDRVLVLLPGADRPGGVSRLLLAALERLGAVGHSVENLFDFAGELAAIRPHCLVASPSQLHTLARDAKLETLRTVLSCTAPLDAELRRQLTAAWSVRIYEYYGMTESGYGGGVECSTGNGYHMNEVDLFFEIVDPASGVPLPDGLAGEVVFTTLNREAMPLVRYRTGDFAAMLAQPCGCGSRLRRLGKIRGRIKRGAAGWEIVNVDKSAYRVRLQEEKCNA